MAGKSMVSMRFDHNLIERLSTVSSKLGIAKTAFVERSVEIMLDDVESGKPFPITSSSSVYLDGDGERRSTT